MTKNSERSPAASPLGRVASFCRRHEIFVPGSRVVVAVSGGADSLCLLHVLVSLAADLGIELCVAHVDHGLRADSAADAAFVAARARRLGLPCSVETIDVLAARRPADGALEAVARRLRYAALRSVAAREGAECIATGHTQDDQAETVLMHMLRGAGIDGLAGMRPRTLDIARPLLSLSREDVETFNAAHGLEPRVDASNRDPSFRRNAIRHEVMPVLERFNPRVKSALARIASTLAPDADWIASEADRALLSLSLPAGPDALVLDRLAFAALPIGLRMHVWRRAVLYILGSNDGLSLVHLDALDALLTGHAAGRRLQLPHGLVCEASGNRMRLAAHPPLSKPSPAVALTLPGVVRFGPWTIRAAYTDGLDASAGQLRDSRAGVYHVTLDRAAIGSSLTVRSFQPGDRVRMPGMRGRKKLQDLFVDRKVPRSIRKHIPILVGKNGILWVVGHAIAAENDTVGTRETVTMSAECSELLW